MKLSTVVIGVCLITTSACSEGPPVHPAQTVPDKLVVMTFDDGVRSHFTVARPLFLEHGFGATFFITHAFSFGSNKEHYMTWEEITQLHADGFEIGNHTGNHAAATGAAAARIDEQLKIIDTACDDAGIPKTRSFGWPGNVISEEGLAALRDYGIELARRGGTPEFERRSGLGPPYDPAIDDPLLIPSIAVPNPEWTFEMLAAAAEQARDGKIAVFQFHGVPEGEHPLTSTTQELFESFVLHLAENDYQVIALRDLEPYIDRSTLPEDAWEAMRVRLGLPR